MANLALAPPMVPQPDRSPLKAMLQEALERGQELGYLAGYAACARHYGHPADMPAGAGPGLFLVPAGGAA